MYPMKKGYLYIFFLYFFINHGLYAEEISKKYLYVINISSSLIKQDIKVPDKLINKYKSYEITEKIKGKLWYKSRVGFFKNKSTANTFTKTLKNIYTDAWVDTVKPADIKFLQQWIESQKQSNQIVLVNKIKKLTNEQQIKLLENGRQLFLDKKYKAAIPIFRKVYESGDGANKQEALELLGLARERNQQLAHAVADYRKYLSLYGDHKASTSRVEQRLMALLTAKKSSRRPINQKKKKKMLDASWRTYGVFFQFYDKDDINISSSSTIVSAEQLTTNLSISSRLVNSDYRIKTQFSALNGYDLENDKTNDNRITSLYIDTLSPDKIYSTRSGRQRGSNGGVSGRFDGFNLGFRLSGATKLNYITGFPVEIHPTVDNKSDKYFNSLGLNIQTDNKKIDYSFFFLEQMADGLVDRNEIGAEFRYITAKHSIISLFDYSLQFEKINYFLAIGNWKFSNKSSLNFYTNHRRSPFLATTNALQGQVGVSSLSDLLETLKEDEIEQLSSDRTAISRTTTIKYTIEHNEKIKYQFDYSLSSLSGTVSSGGVASTSDTGNEYSYAVSLLGKKWLMEYDNYLMRFRASQLASSNAAIIDLSARFRFNKQWRIGPGYRYDTRDYDDGKEITRDQLFLRMDYRQSKSIRFQLNLTTIDKTTTSPSATTQNQTDHIIHMGYIYLF